MATNETSNTMTTADEMPTQEMYTANTEVVNIVNAPILTPQPVPVLLPPVVPKSDTPEPVVSTKVPTQSVFNNASSYDFPQPGTSLQANGDLVIVDHGDWSAITQVAIHDDSEIEAPLVPSGTVFCHRESDKLDWYIFSRSDTCPFKYGSVLATCLLTPKGYVVQGVFFDKQRIFPANSRVIEIQNYSGPVDGVHKAFELKYYNPDAKTITDFPITLDDLKAYASTVKDRIESAGITVNGMSVATDRASQAMITQTVVGLQLMPNITINWKNPDNTSQVLSADFIKVMATFVLLHVSNTFNLYPSVISKIIDGTLKSYGDIDVFYTSNINTKYTFTPPSSNTSSGA